MIACQRSCNSWIISLFLMNFFPIFPLNYQFWLFLLNLMQKFSHSFGLQMDKFERCHEDFYWCWQEKTGKKLAYFCLRRGEKLEFFAKIFTLEKAPWKPWLAWFEHRQFQKCHQPLPPILPKIFVLQLFRTKLGKVERCQCSS